MLNSFPAISVVMAVYEKDKSSQTKEAIDSILVQTHAASEFLITIDGPISENLNQLLEEYETRGEVTLIRHPKNMGLGHALNTAINAATCPLIARMDADDISTPDRLKLQHNLLNDRNLDLVGGQTIEFGQTTDDILSVRTVPCQHEKIIQFMKLRSPFSHPTILFKKALYEQVNGYSESLSIEDYDFFVRCHLSNARFGNTNETVLWYRMGEKYSTLKRRRGFHYAKNELKLYRKFYGNGFFSLFDFLRASFLKIPLRVIPYPVFCWLYKTLTRK